jgi:hypothetical protein
VVNVKRDIYEWLMYCQRRALWNMTHNVVLLILRRRIRPQDAPASQGSFFLEVFI